jgi:ABC-2 type transport system ATP-binding protein
MSAAGPPVGANSVPSGGSGAHVSASDSAIVVAHLWKSYGDVEAVKGISFAVRRGTTTALLGGNGAGKTTTLSMLLGVLTPSSGRVTVLGADMPAERHRVLPRMNFTSPYVDLPKRLTVRQNLAVFCDLYGVRRSRERIAAVANDCDLVDLLPRPYGNLSAGQRTRVSLAKAVLNEPDVLLLDEPTASLDPDIGDRMRSYLERYQRRTGCTMLLASHHMGEVERMCDDVIMLRAGTVVDQGAPRQLIARYGRENMEEVFLDIARGGDGAERAPGAGAEERAA